MVGPQTKIALKSRALTAAARLDVWIARLEEEMKKQGIELMPQLNLADLAGDSMMPVTLKRQDLRDLILEMREQRHELRRFAQW